VTLPLLLLAPLAMAETPNLRVDYLPAEPWPMGQRLFVAGHGVNLRAAASTDAPVVTELDLGTPVLVQALLADGAEVGGRGGRWYAVKLEEGGRQGALFGGVLSPARIDADLDQDGETELAVLTWGWDNKKVIRVREPAIAGAAAVTELDLGPTHDIEGPQVELWAGVTGAGETGIPLLKLHTPGREMCGSGSATHYVSYRSEGAGTLGTLREAVRDHHWSDAPVYSYAELSWEPGARAVTVREVVSDGESDEQITVTRRVLRDGVFEPEAPAGTHPD
jgi:hypothetical protein